MLQSNHADKEPSGTHSSTCCLRLCSGGTLGPSKNQSPKVDQRVIPRKYLHSGNVCGCHNDIIGSPSARDAAYTSILTTIRVYIYSYIMLHTCIDICIDICIDR